MDDEVWQEERRQAIRQWSHAPNLHAQHIARERILQLLIQRMKSTRPIPEEGTMSTVIVNLNDQTFVRAEGAVVVVDWQGFEEATPEDLVDYAEAHGRPLHLGGAAPMVQKTFTRQDFADRLQHHIAVGDVDLPELFAERVIDSIRPQDVARLGRIDEDDLAAITLILSLAISRITGNDHG